MEADAHAIRQFFARLHGPEPAGWLIVWTRQDKVARAFDLARDGELERAVEYCRERAEAADVYAGVGLQAAKPAKGRGGEEGVCSIPGLWADIDISSASHRSQNLPPSEEAALGLIEAVGLRPSILVRSGFGLQVYWRFKEPLLLDSDEDRTRAKSLSVRFQLLLRQVAKARGWTIDPTADLCRLLRVPGTFNRKLSDDVRLVTAEYLEAAYSLDDFEEILTGIAEPVEGPALAAARDLPPAKLPAILAGCPWMRHCRDDAATLPEPEWYRMLTIIARCEEAEHWAHELSKPYPNYNHSETKAKLQQASRDEIAPVTCAYVQNELGGDRYCSACLFRGQVNSPITIGRLEAPRSAAPATVPPPSIFESLAPYPTPLGEDAYYGLAGRFVRLVEPHTEADPSFLLIQFLVYAGNILGRRAFVWAGADRHYSNLFLCGVGPTSAGRKGSAAAPIQLFFKDIDEEWVCAIQSGLSSGEGLIWAVRDPIYRREKVSQGKGKPAEYQEVLVDPGVEDKRLLVQQSEFFGALQVMRRQGNTLSPVIRDAFDKGHLNSMVKNSPAKATGAHISIVGNITKEELLRGLLAEEMDNGFANRFLWACSRRSKCLPEGGRMWQVIESEAWRELQRDFNRIHYLIEGPVRRDAEASDIWGFDNRPDMGVYRELTRERHGMYGACTARAAALTLRLSLIYALLDGSREIRREHLLAALEVWRYCDESARYIFGDTLGDPTADEILRALRASAAGLTRSEINGLFDGHKPSAEISRALLVLHNSGLARFEKVQTKGRPTERWFPVGQNA